MRDRRDSYGTSYLTAKIQIEKPMAEWAIRQGDDFTMKRFFDTFFGAGVIPVVLTRWEMTSSRDRSEER